MNIRRLKPGDGPLWKKAVELLVADEDKGPKLVTISEAEQALGDNRCYLILAERCGEVVGLLSAYSFPDLVSGGYLVYLYDIEVSISNRNEGFGRAMVDQLKMICQGDGVHLIWTGTESDNMSARKLFEKTCAELDSESYCEYEWEL